MPAMMESAHIHAPGTAKRYSRLNPRYLAATRRAAEKARKAEARRAFLSSLASISTVATLALMLTQALLNG